MVEKTPSWDNFTYLPIATLIFVFPLFSIKKMSFILSKANLSSPIKEHASYLRASLFYVIYLFVTDYRNIKQKK